MSIKDVNIYSFYDECYVYLSDYRKLQQENQQLEEQLKLVESLASFNMPDNIPMVCMFKADYERNKYEYETIDKYKSILDEIREYCMKGYPYVENASHDILQILDKVME